VTERGSEFEAGHRTKTGEIKNILITTKTFNSAGKTFLHCVYRDITEFKKVQNALIESEARYRQLVELAQEGIWAIDNDFSTVFVNPRMSEMLGYAESEMIGKKLFEFLDKEKIQKIKGILQQFKNHEIDGPIEYAFPRKDGTHIYTIITMSTMTDDQGQTSGMLAVVADITERKRAEKALKESEELSRAIVSNAPIGIATSDASYHFVSANEAFCRILGYEEDELRKLTFKEITHPEDLPASAQKMGELQNGKSRSFVMEKRYIKKDGATIIGRVITNTIRDQMGQPILFIAELEDITNSKQLEGDVRASEERFRAISTSAMDAIILSDEEDKVIYWNPAAEKTFGFKENEAVGRKLKELVIPLHGHLKHEALLKELLIQPLSKKHFGLLALKKDGTMFPMDLTLVSIKLKDKQCLLSTIRDITESKAMEEALRQERDMLENMAASIDAGLTIIGRDYRILWGNKLLKQISGNDLENKLCYSVYNKSDEICHDCGVRKVFENGATVDRHDYNYKFDGRDEWVELIATPVKDKNGKVIAAMELIVNITERKKLQTKLGEYSQKLEELVQKRTVQLKNTQLELVKSERLAAIGELAGMIGHDLRNPLTGIKNSAYFMKKKGNDISRAQAQEMLEIIDKCVDYSNKIVNDLLEYSREVHLEPHEESIKKLLTESLSLLDLPEKIEVKNHLNDEPTVKVDSDKIRRVFINLIKNAVDAMPDGGKITIDSHQINGRLEVSFSDTGRGISDEVLPKLFMPLFTTKAQGMGFGLAICKRFIEAHGGTITVKTVKEKGTSFTITLPIEPKFQVGGENTWINIPESS
jgi:PAS domain S-box-containing protein